MSGTLQSKARRGIQMNRIMEHWNIYGNRTMKFSNLVRNISYFIVVYFWILAALHDLLINNSQLRTIYVYAIIIIILDTLQPYLAAMSYHILAKSQELGYISRNKRPWPVNVLASICFYLKGVAFMLLSLAVFGVGVF